MSVVEFHGEHSNYQCGYCKQANSCQSHGMWAHKLSCQDYQDLIDRGWRRSGCYCYKPIMDITCCPSYTIKCDALNFRLHKSHKKILKRMHKFLRDGIKDANSQDADVQLDYNIGGCIETPSAQPNSLDPEVLGSLLHSPTCKMVETIETAVVSEDLGTTNKACTSNTSLSSTGSNVGTLPKKAKLVRIERKREKLQKKGVSGTELEQLMQASTRKKQEKTLEDFLSEAPRDDEQPAHRLKVKHVHSCNVDLAASFKLYSHYQQCIHKDPSSKLSMDRYKSFLVKSPLKIVKLLTSGTKFQESLHISYALYAKYQTAIHNDPPGGIADYQDFLVKSPLKGSKEFGSFHQQYWLDDRLIAVGVIDVLPYCVSSVYFFYDPEFKFLSLGTYGSLRELAYVRMLHKQTPSIKHYYMGFYIHSCPKMRYKSNLQPSHLLCPEVYSWHLLDRTILAKLDVKKYNRLNDDHTAQDANKATDQDLNDVLLLVGRSYMPYSQYLAVFGTEIPILSKYAQLVGNKCARNMMLYN